MYSYSTTPSINDHPPLISSVNSQELTQVNGGERYHKITQSFQEVSGLNAEILVSRTVLRVDETGY